MDFTRGSDIFPAVNWRVAAAREHAHNLTWEEWLLGRYRITVDTGGTFSDFVCLDEETGTISIAKVPSTPDDPSRAILHGIETVLSTGIRPEEIGFFCHGTTVGTNALLEHKGAKTALLVTEGFRGVYEVGEQARPYGAAIFDVMYDRPPILVPRSLTYEVAERVDFRGQVLRGLDEPALRATIRKLAAQGVRSIAVCLLFSFLYPAHERRVRAIIGEEMPGCDVSLSCDVLPQIREYYRLSTTVINAYLQPLLARYIANLDLRLAAAGLAMPQKYVMQSNGGMASFAVAAERPVTTVLSGPAGGVTAGVAAGRVAGIANLITFDMGGTSCDVALIRDAEPALASRGKIEGYDIAVPMMDINTVSAGGGTMAVVNALKELEVGPHSAGAVPGPACYGRGGETPTITDCNLVLGYLSARNFLGGGMTLDVQRARAAIEEKIAAPLAIPVEQAAEGIIRIIDVKMEEAIKAISTMRGHDLRDFMLLAFGGAGPAHAGRIARHLGLAGVIVPPHPGVFSAVGLQISDVKHDYVRSRLAPITELTADEIEAMFAALESEALGALRRDGFAPADIRLDRAIDMRYAGQGYEIPVPCAADTLRSGGLPGLRKSFDDLHKAMFGHVALHEPVEIVSYRLRGIGCVPAPPMPEFAAAGIPLAQALREYRQAWFESVPLPCPVYERERLDVGMVLAGPAIIDQFDSTTVVSPGQAARVDRWKNLIITEGVMP
jgi:N-methylhydantoinase A